MSDKRHWNRIYAQRDPTEVSWYRPRLERSLAWIDEYVLEPTAHVVDAGGGASTLADDLLARGFTRVTVVDLAERALAHSRLRLGEHARRVRWVVADATVPLFEEGSVDLWHDRAVFHFLTEEARRAAYLEQVRRSVRPGGHAIIATFGPGGPERCSGLPVVRHAAEEIAAALGEEFELLAGEDESHVTPSGARHAFAYALGRRTRR